MPPRLHALGRRCRRDAILFEGGAGGRCLVPHPRAVEHHHRLAADVAGLHVAFPQSLRHVRRDPASFLGVEVELIVVAVGRVFGVELGLAQPAVRHALAGAVGPALRNALAVVDAEDPVVPGLVPEVLGLA